MTHFSWRVWAVALIAVASVGGIGFIAASSLASPTIPPTLATSHPIRDVPVVLEESNDVYSVRLLITRSPAIDLQSQATGIVTASACAAGTKVTSGVSPYSVDGQAIIALNLASPPWRDLSLGDHGDDVVALKNELERLGFTVTTGDRFAWADLEAIRALLRSAGADDRVDTVALSSFLWIPAPETTVAQCAVPLGHRVDEGSAVISVGGDVDIRFAALPPQVLSGARSLHVDDLAMPLSDALEIPVEAVPAILATPSYRGAVEDPEATSTVEIAASIALIDAVPLASLPPGAITLTSATAGCVGDGSTTYSLQVVTSELGRTVVRFDGDTVPDMVRLEAPPKCA